MPESLSKERLAEIRERAESATPGPWHYATAPRDPEKTTKAEYVTGALDKWHPNAPLWTCWAPDPEGGPDDYVIPALTGDGPTSKENATFVAQARTDVPELLAEVDRLRAIVNDGGNQAAKYRRELQESRRENADLRANGGHLAGERDRLRAELADLHNVEADLRAQRDNLARILNCVKTMIAPLVQEES